MLPGVRWASGLMLAGFLFLAARPGTAQSPSVVPRPPDGGNREMLVSILIPSLPNAPFNATVNTEAVRQLADGSSIRVQNHRAIARDRAGRIFQERRLLVPEDGRHESVVTQTEISDPVAHTLYICVPRERVCQLEQFTATDFGPPAAVAPSGRAGGPSNLTREDLGQQTIGGVEVTGTLETGVIASGAIGNDSPLLVKREFWYSPKLGINLISKRQDPRFGTQDFEVSDIVLGQPDARLFEVPRGSRVIDLRKESPSPALRRQPSH